jgi:predicted metal-binding protein
MTRSLLVLSLCTLLASATARADIQKSGPEEFPGKNEVSGHLGGQYGATSWCGVSGGLTCGGTPGGFRLSVEYGRQLKDLLWFNVGVNLVVSSSCVGADCPYTISGNTVEPNAGIKLKFKTQIPLVAFAKFDATLIGIWGRYCNDSGIAIAARAAGGANYFILKNLGVGLELGTTLGPAFLHGATGTDCFQGTYSSHVEFYAAIDFNVGVEFIF